MERDLAVIVVKVYSWLQWISGALGLIAGVVLISAPAALEGLFSGSPILGGLFTGIGVGAGVLVLVMAALDIVVGFGLWRRQNWARIALLALAALSLLAFPLGTIYGLITILLFTLDEGVRSLFTKPVDAERVERRKNARA